MSRAPFIWTASGRRFFPLDPRVEDISIEDIAHALAHQCRFLGHTRAFYSVAEHSVRVARLLSSWGHSREVQLWGLLHDASEAYLVDVPSPLKSSPLFAPYRAAEERMQEAVCRRFGLPVVEPDVVRRADRALLATEIRDVMPSNMDPWTLLEEPAAPVCIVPWASEEAKGRFLMGFGELTGVRG